MSYTTVTRVLNEQDMLQAALTRVAEKKLLDPKYKIMMSGLVENYTPEESESEPKDILQLILCNKETTEKSTKIFYMEDDLMKEYKWKVDRQLKRIAGEEDE